MVAFAPEAVAAAQKLGPLRAYCDCCVGRSRERGDPPRAGSSRTVQPPSRKISFKTTGELGDDRDDPDDDTYMGPVRALSKRISVFDDELEVDHGLTKTVSSASIESFGSSIPGLDASLARVVRIAETMLPSRKLSPWQLGCCTPEHVRIYLDARADDAEKAAELLALTLQWREAHKDLLTGDRIPRWTGDTRVLARSRDGHPLVYVCFRNQARFPSWRDAIDHIIGVLEAAVGAMRGDAATLDAVVDCHGFRLSSNLDPRSAVGTIAAMKHPYRGRLRYGFIADAPRAFDWMWSLAVPHLPPSSRDKFTFAPRAEVVRQLAERVDPEVGQAVDAAMAANRAAVPGTSWRVPSELAD